MNLVKKLWGISPLLGLSILLAHNTHQEPNTSFSNETLSLNTSSTWHDLSLNNKTKLVAREKSVCVEKLNIKSTEATKIKSVTLVWRGPRLTNISGALYVQQKPTDKLIPIEQNFVCDGTWDNEEQTFTFEPHYKIVATEMFYLVLSFSRELERRIRRGTFILPEENGVVVEDV